MSLYPKERNNKLSNGFVHDDKPSMVKPSKFYRCCFQPIQTDRSDHCKNIFTKLYQICSWIKIHFPAKDNHLNDDPSIQQSLDIDTSQSSCCSSLCNQICPGRECLEKTVNVWLLVQRLMVAGDEGWWLRS